jgi:ClpP class serine protease
MNDNQQQYDVFLYNGGIERSEDLRFIEFIADNKKHDALKLVLVTPGGNPDAAYKIARYIQSTYGDFHCFVPGFCKSAGTLLAIGANELIFSPYGELGPLDVQLTKAEYQRSISDRRRARKTHFPRIDRRNYIWKWRGRFVPNCIALRVRNRSLPLWTDFQSN